MSLLKKLTAGMEKKYFLYTALSPFFMLGEVLMETTIPLVMAGLVDRGIASRDSAYVIKHGAIMVSMAVFSLFCGVMCGRISSLAAFGFSKNLRKKLFSRVQAFSFSNIDRFGTDSLITRLTSDVTNLQNVYQNMIRTAVRAPIMIIFGVIMAASINLKLARIFFLVIPLLALFVGFVAVKAYPRYREMIKNYDSLNRIVQENLIAIRVVKSFVRGDYECKKFDGLADKLQQSQVNAEKIVIINMPLMQLSIYMCIVSVLWFGGNMVLDGTMLSGSLISFISYVTQILMSLMMLSRLFVTFVLSRASLARIMEVLEEEIEIKNPDLPIKTPSDFTISFDHVYFSYDKKMEHAVLSDINLEIPASSTVGILGGTGSSKSTLVSLIARLYDVGQGRILIGGQDIRLWDLKELRKKLGFVLQKNLLFSGSIAENLRWGNENASDEEIREACRLACADEFISRFPSGYDTDLGQGGVNLSGGQKQRLCIARALVKKPEILIFDDSTSAVDTATDRKIRSSLKKEFPGSTKIIISQRIASIQDADFILLMEDGKIIGQGSHQELLSSSQIYRELYQSQMAQN